MFFTANGPAPVRRGLRCVVGAGIALVLAGSLGACSDDGFTLPSGEQLKQFVADAQDQARTIGSDASKLADQLGTLPETVRGTAQDALDKSKAAADSVQSAVEDAKNTRDGAEQSLTDARTQVEDAKKRVDDTLDQLRDRTDAPSVEARGKLEKLRAELERLQQQVTS